jgi:hypothetical protein
MDVRNLVRRLACRHLSVLNQAVARGESPPSVHWDPLGLRPRTTAYNRFAPNVRRWAGGSLSWHERLIEAGPLSQHRNDDMRRESNAKIKQSFAAGCKRPFIRSGETPRSDYLLAFR